MFTSVTLDSPNTIFGVGFSNLGVELRCAGLDSPTTQVPCFCTQLPLHPQATTHSCMLLCCMLLHAALMQLTRSSHAAPQHSLPSRPAPLHSAPSRPHSASTLKAHASQRSCTLPMCYYQTVLVLPPYSPSTPPALHFNAVLTQGGWGIMLGLARTCYCG